MRLLFTAFLLNFSFSLSIAIAETTMTPKPLFNSGPQKVNLIELYSSEGCSSCPPAERWMAAQRNSTGLWKKIVPIEFHVDYWNYLGWVDPFSNQRFTQRQRKYASEWGRNRINKPGVIYTPGFTLNGHEWNRSDKSKSAQNTNNRPGELKIFKIASKEQVYKAVFIPNKKELKQKEFKLFATLLGNGLTTKVPTGENAGRTLEHEFVVLKLKTASMQKKKSIHTATVSLKRFEKYIKKKPESYSIAFWVTDGKSLKPLQAVGGDI